MKIRHIAATIALIATASWQNAEAQPDVEFSEMEHSLGTLVWHNSAQATFTMKNTGRKNIVITSVEPDCGCTLVSWTQGNIAPGKTASISARYDAEQLGHFSKSFGVYLDDELEPIYLTISGKVVNADMTTQTAKLEYHFGSVDLNCDDIDFGDVYGDEEPFKTIEIVNRGKDIVTPTLMHLPAYLTASYAPEKLYPGASGKILVTLSPDRLPDYGLTKVGVFLSTQPGEKVNRDNEIEVSATLLPDLEELYGDAEETPEMVLDKEKIDVGTLGGSKRNDQIVISNEGEAPLEIIAIQGYNAGIGFSLGSKKIKPGGRTKLKVSVNPQIFQFKGRHAIVLITNDPENPKVIIPIEAKK